MGGSGGSRGREGGGGGAASKAIARAGGAGVSPAEKEVLGPPTTVGGTNGPTKLTAGQKESVESYANDGFTDVNTYHRTGEIQGTLSKEAVQSITRHLDKLIASGRLTEDKVLYRGVDAQYFKGVQVGSTLSDKGFLSTTRDLSVTRGFGHGALLEISVPKGTHALDMDHHNQMGEQEILLRRGAKLRVTSITPGSTEPGNYKRTVYHATYVK